MVGNGRKDQLEKPLQGAVLCCTSIPPEQRTRYAEIAAQMGAEHKLDLTSDVTHLLVGDSNTPKYKYIAREREDVKVLRPEWVEAVRQSWMTGESFDLKDLEDHYRFPTFAGLSICVTGFEDLAFRAQLQENISANGADYRGDLTKAVTHLIAHIPEGKKYQYAEQWKIHVVSLRWLEDSLDRGMVLEEIFYHPTMPPGEQGKGAWNREAKSQIHLGKRAREEQNAPEMPRKLRRTASAKLGSQSDSLWGDITGGGFDEGSGACDQLRTSKSLPAIRPVVLEPESFAADSTSVEPADEGHRNQRQQSSQNVARVQRGFFDTAVFFIFGFNPRQKTILRDCLQNNGGTIVDSLMGIDKAPHVPAHSLFVLVPYNLPRSEFPSISSLASTPRIVTDMWIERCLDNKAFLDPYDHPTCTPLQRFPIKGFEKLIVNSTGFERIELLHVAKLVKLMGGSYDEILKPSISVLVCNNGSSNQDKPRHARAWNIPVVSAAWLWSGIRSGQLQPFQPYLVNNPRADETEPERLRKQRAQEQLRGKADEQEEDGTSKRTETFQDVQKPERTMHAKDLLNYKRRKDLDYKQIRHGVDFQEDSSLGRIRGEKGHSSNKQSRDCSPNSMERPNTIQPTPEADSAETLPLQEISTNSPPKHLPSPPAKNKKKPLFRAMDGPGSLPGADQEDDFGPAHPLSVSHPASNHLTRHADSINGAVQELLTLKTNERKASNMESDRATKRKRLLGRALSNLSNSSKEGSSIKPSRASSVDSMNTDGVGSIIGGDTLQAGRSGSSGYGGRGCLTGRATARDTTQKDSSRELGDPSLYQTEYTEEEPVPQMTQLGYAEHDEAIQMRQKLAEKRRARSRQGHETKPMLKGDKRIKDDDAILGGGWGAGGRTRNKERSPKVMADF